MFLDEKAFKFKTVLGDTAMTSGCHYWEVYVDERTKIFLKVGVSCSNDFDMNTSFSDFNFGYSYFGQGSLRHESSKSGEKYGKPFKNEGIIGVFLDMNFGTLSFSKDGEFFGVAFKSEQLTKGPIYPAISLINKGGCELSCGIPAPTNISAPKEYLMKQQILQLEAYSQQNQVPKETNPLQGNASPAYPMMQK